MRYQGHELVSAGGIFCSLDVSDSQRQAVVFRSDVGERAHGAVSVKHGHCCSLTKNESHFSGGFERRLYIKTPKSNVKFCYRCNNSSPIQDNVLLYHARLQSVHAAAERQTVRSVTRNGGAVSKRRKNLEAACQVLRELHLAPLICMDGKILLLTI